MKVRAAILIEFEVILVQVRRLIDIFCNRCTCLCFQSTCDSVFTTLFGWFLIYQRKDSNFSIKQSVVIIIKLDRVINLLLLHVLIGSVSSSNRSTLLFFGMKKHFSSIWATLNISLNSRFVLS